MKFSINKKQLENELALVQGIVEKASTIPAISNCLIEAVDEETIRVTGTDLDTTIIAHVAANVANAGEICISAKKLYDIVKLLPQGEIFFSTEAKIYGAKIECGKSNFRVLGISPDVFPETPKSAGVKVNLPSVVLQTFIKHTSFAITNEQSRFTLSGAKFEIKDRTARMVTTDGHRLCYIETTFDDFDPRFSADTLIPRKALAELLKLANDCAPGGEITFWEDANHLNFETGNRRLITRKLSGTFPNYEMVIPKDTTETATFEAAALLAAIKRVSQMADERSQSVKLTLRTNEMTISAQSAEEGEAQENIAVEYSGEETSIKFQYSYVLDFINSVKDNAEIRISMSFRDANAQTLFRPASENGSRFLTVIMPLRH
ncbi:MAG TPA: DNA polymerase III subunit beta [Pyrinomonadaceae bacterium]|nr:DNA polymerase III subunit beta [Pyrinomonadaceae bacterium]